MQWGRIWSGIRWSCSWPPGWSCPPLRLPAGCTWAAAPAPAPAGRVEVCAGAPEEPWSLRNPCWLEVSFNRRALLDGRMTEPPWERDPFSPQFACADRDARHSCGKKRKEPAPSCAKNPLRQSTERSPDWDLPVSNRGAGPRRYYSPRWFDWPRPLHLPTAQDGHRHRWDEILRRNRLQIERFERFFFWHHSQSR